MNYYCTGSSIGNLIMSLKHEEAEGQEYLRIMLRYDDRNARPFDVCHMTHCEVCLKHPVDFHPFS